MGFELVNTDGAVVLHSISTDREPEAWPQLKAGFNALECRIPAGVLNAGQYYVRPRFGRWGERFMAPDVAIVFEAHLNHLQTPHPQLPRSGVTLPILEWTALEVEESR